MVSFVCDSCASTLKKAKVLQHSYSCGSYYYSCIDCGEVFDTDSIKGHNSCISEAEKHQGSMYKGQKGKKQNPRGQDQQKQPQQQQQQQQQPKQENGSSSNGSQKRAREEPAAEEKSKKEEESSKKAKKEESSSSSSSFDAVSVIKSTLAKKSGSCVSLKKVRKALMKAQGSEDKEAANKQLMEALLANASNVKLCWGEE